MTDTTIPSAAQRWRFALLLFAAVLAILVASLAPTVTLWDAGEFLAASRILGVPHPPGTPLWVMIAHTWGTLVPIGEWAYRINLMTAVASAVAATCFGLVAWEGLRKVPALGGDTPAWFAPVGAGVAAFAAAFTYTNWQNSNEAEVYAIAMLVIGLGTFVLVGLAGLSVIDRYLLVPSLMVMIFAAVTLGGWSMLRPGVPRNAWAVAAVLVIAYGVYFTATRVNFRTFDSELVFRGQSHAALEALFRNPKVRAGMKCGPVSVPNHKLIPDTRWVLNAGADDVIARSDPNSKRRLGRGVAVYATSRQALLRQGFTPDDSTTEDIQNSLPLPGFTWVAATADYGAYVRC